MNNINSMKHNQNKITSSSTNEDTLEKSNLYTNLDLPSYKVNSKKRKKNENYPLLRSFFDSSSRENGRKSKILNSYSQCFQFSKKQFENVKKLKTELNDLEDLEYNPSIDDLPNFNQFSELELSLLQKIFCGCRSLTWDEYDSMFVTNTRSESKIHIPVHQYEVSNIPFYKESLHVNDQKLYSHFNKESSLKSTVLAMNEFDDCDESLWASDASLSPSTDLLHSSFNEFENFMVTSVFDNTPQPSQIIGEGTGVAEQKVEASQSNSNETSGPQITESLPNYVIRDSTSNRKDYSRKSKTKVTPILPSKEKPFVEVGNGFQGVFSYKPPIKVKSKPSPPVNNGRKRTILPKKTFQLDQQQGKKLPWENILLYGYTNDSQMVGNDLASCSQMISMIVPDDGDVLKAYSFSENNNKITSNNKSSELNGSSPDTNSRIYQRPKISVMQGIDGEETTLENDVDSSDSDEIGVGEDPLSLPEDPLALQDVPENRLQSPKSDMSRFIDLYLD